MFRKVIKLVCSFAIIVPFIANANERLQVFVSISPQQFLLESIGREQVEVKVMLEPGDSPETFDPGLKQIAALSSARLYFRIGLAFEEKWLGGIGGKSQNIKVIDCCENIIKSKFLLVDKHVWLSVRNAQLIAALMKQELVSIDPDHAFEYEKNYLELIAQLKQLDKDIDVALQRRRTDYFIISHAAFGYYAADYGLKQLSLENSGRQVGAKSIVSFIQRARSENIKTLFVQKQHRTAAAIAFANEIDAKIVEIDPLRQDYIENLRQITMKMVEAMR